MQRGKNC